MYDRNNTRAQGPRYTEGYGGSDGFMERFGRMGQDAPMTMGPADGYGQPMPSAMQQGGMPGAMPQGMQQGGMMPQGMPGVMPMQQSMQQPMQQPVPQAATQGMSAADLEQLRSLSAEISGKIGQMEEICNRNTACVDEIREIVDGQDRRIRTMLEEIRNTPQTAAGAEGAVNGDLVDKLEKMLDERREEDDRRMEERTQADLSRRQADAMRADEMREKLEDLEKEFQTACEKIDSAAASLSGLGDTVGASVTDGMSAHVEAIDKNTHDVGVRVYRNVQASMSDFLAKQTSTLDTAITGLNQRMETMEDSFLHRRSAGTPLTVAVLVTGLVNLAILVAYILSSYL